MTPETKLAEEATVELKHLERGHPRRQQQTSESLKRALVENGYQIKYERSPKERSLWKRAQPVRTVEQLFYRKSCPKKNLSFRQQGLQRQLQNLEWVTKLAVAVVVLLLHI